MRSPLTARKTANEAKEEDQFNDSGIMVELDTTATSYSSTSSSSSSFTSSASSSTTTSATTTPVKVSRIRDTRESHGRLLTVFPRPSRSLKNTKTTVSMARKLVKKAIKTRQRMENEQNRRQRHYQLLEQLCQEPKDNGDNEATKIENYEEPPPRPPTRRCMFYREDTDAVKVLRVKQF